MKTLTVAALFMLATNAMAGGLYFGTVIGVHDGDTLSVLMDKREVKVRVAYIDAPELGQPFGQTSKKALSELCYQRKAAFYMDGRDRYGRYVSVVLCDGADVAQLMVRAGMAWVYDRYTPRISTLYVTQENAQYDKRGLWADPNPVRPWEWRRLQRASKEAEWRGR